MRQNTFDYENDNLVNKTVFLTSTKKRQANTYFTNYT